MADFAALPTLSGATATLMVKVAVAAGSIRRFLIGDPQIQVLEVLAGRTLDRLSAAAHLAERDDVVVDTATLAQFEAPLRVVGWRFEAETQLACRCHRRTAACGHSKAVAGSTRRSAVG